MYRWHPLVTSRLRVYALFYLVCWSGVCIVRFINKANLNISIQTFTSNRNFATAVFTVLGSRWSLTVIPKFQALMLLVLGLCTPCWQSSVSTILVSSSSSSCCSLIPLAITSWWIKLCRSSFFQFRIHIALMPCTNLLGAILSGILTGVLEFSIFSRSWAILDISCACLYLADLIHDIFLSSAPTGLGRRYCF